MSTVSTVRLKFPSPLADALDVVVVVVVVVVVAVVAVAALLLLLLLFLLLLLLVVVVVVVVVVLVVVKVPRARARAPKPFFKRHVFGARARGRCTLKLETLKLDRNKKTKSKPWYLHCFFNMPKTKFNTKRMNI